MEWSCELVLFNSWTSMLFSITSSHLFFGLLLNFWLQNFIFIGGALSPFILLSKCTSHRNLCSRTLLSFPCLSHLIFHQYWCYLLVVFSQSYTSHFDSLQLSFISFLWGPAHVRVDIITLGTSFKTFLQASQLHWHNSFTQYTCYILNIFPFRSYSCSDSFLHSSKARTSLEYESSVTFSIPSLSHVTSTLSLEFQCTQSIYFLDTKSTALLRHFVFQSIFYAPNCYIWYIEWSC